MHTTARLAAETRSLLLRSWPCLATHLYRLGASAAHRARGGVTAPDLTRQHTGACSRLRVGTGVGSHQGHNGAGHRARAPHGTSVVRAVKHGRKQGVDAGEHQPSRGVPSFHSTKIKLNHTRSCCSCCWSSEAQVRCPCYRFSGLTTSVVSEAEAPCASVALLAVLRPFPRLAGCLPLPVVADLFLGGPSSTSDSSCGGTTAVFFFFDTVSRRRVRAV